MKRLNLHRVIFVVFMMLPGLFAGQAEATICPGGVPCVDSNDIINGQVGGADISGAVVVPGTRIVDGSVTSADLGADACGTDEIAAGAVGSSEVLDNSLSAADLGTDACGPDEIAAGAVGSLEIAAGAVGTAQINSAQVQARVSGICAAGSSVRTVNVDGTVVCETDDTGGTASDLVCVGCVAATDIGTDAVAADEIAAGAVGGAEVLDNSLTAADLAPDSVFSPEIAASAVGSSEILDGAVGSADIATGSIGGPHLSTGGVSVAGVSFIEEFDDDVSVTGGCKARRWLTGYVYYSGGNNCDAYAPIQIPDGAIVTGFSCTVLDNSAVAGAALSLDLMRVDFTTGGGFFMASTSASVDSPAVQILSDATILNSTVDNGGFAYFVSADFGFADLSAVTTLLRLYGCSVTYN